MRACEFIRRRVELCTLRLQILQCVCWKCNGTEAASAHYNVQDSVFVFMARGLKWTSACGAHGARGLRDGLGGRLTWTLRNLPFRAPYYDFLIKVLKKVGYVGLRQELQRPRDLITRPGSHEQDFRIPSLGLLLGLFKGTLMLGFLFKGSRRVPPRRYPFFCRKDVMASL